MENKTRPHIGLLGIMQELYDDMIPGITQHQEAYARKIVARLSGTIDVDFPRAARNRQDIEEIMDRFNAGDLDGVIFINLVYGPALNLVNALKRNHLPILVVNTQPVRTVTADWNMNDLTYNQGIHGVQDTVNAIIRTVGDHFEVITEDWNTDVFVEKVSQWARVARAVSMLGKMKIAWFGKMNGMHDTIVDYAAIMRVLGPEVREEHMGDLYREMEALTQDEVQAQLEEDRKNFKIDKNMPPESHEYAVKLMLGFEKILVKGGYAGYTANFDLFRQDGRFRQIGLLAASNLMAKGYGYAAEGDVNAAIAVATGHLIGRDAHFTEMYAMDFERDSMLMSHMGEGNWKVARKDRPVRLAYRELGIGGLENPPTTVFMAEPGEATIVSLAPMKGDHFRLIAMKGTVLDTGEYPTIEMPYFHFRPDSGVRDANTGWLKAGGTHHQAMLPGDHRKSWKMLSNMLGLEYMEV